MKEVDSCLKYSSVGHQMGLQDGDLPVAVDGQELAYFEGSILQEIANGETLTVEREGKRVEVAIPVDFMRAVLASKEPFFAMDLPARIDSIAKGHTTSLLDRLPLGGGWYPLFLCLSIEMRLLPL